jgi:hypothetical protein
VRAIAGNYFLLFVVSCCAGLQADFADLNSHTARTIQPESAPRKPAIGPDGRAVPGPRGRGTSANWAGYVVSESQPYISVTGTWTVPTVSYAPQSDSPPKEYTSTWIGIGGNPGDNTLIQIGTEQDVTANGTTTYYPWYELIPAVQTSIPEPVTAGDVMSASITCTAQCVTGGIQSWSFVLQDITKGWMWRLDNVQYASSLGAAEWIMEATTVGEIISELPNYGSVAFSGATANGLNPQLSASVDGLSMVNSETGASLSSPSNPVGGNSFTVSQGSVAPPPPPPPPPPDTLGTLTCHSAMNLGDITAQETRFTGSFPAGGNATAVYRFHVTKYTTVSAFPLTRLRGLAGF